MLRLAKRKDVCCIECQVTDIWLWLTGCLSYKQSNVFLYPYPLLNIPSSVLKRPGCLTTYRFLWKSTFFKNWNRNGMQKLVTSIFCAWISINLSWKSKQHHNFLVINVWYLPSFNVGLYWYGMVKHIIANICFNFWFLRLKLACIYFIQPLLSFLLEKATGLIYYI